MGPPLPLAGNANVTPTSGTLYHNPLLKVKPAPPTEAEELARRGLAKASALPPPPDVRPYVRLTPRKRGIEVGVRGTF